MLCSTKTTELRDSGFKVILFVNFSICDLKKKQEETICYEKTKIPWHNWKTGNHMLPNLHREWHHAPSANYIWTPYWKRKCRPQPHHQNGEQTIYNTALPSLLTTVAGRIKTKALRMVAGSYSPVLKLDILPSGRYKPLRHRTNCSKHGYRNIASEALNIALF